MVNFEGTKCRKEGVSAEILYMLENQNNLNKRDGLWLASK